MDLETWISRLEEALKKYDGSARAEEDPNYQLVIAALQVAPRELRPPSQHFVSIREALGMGLPIEKEEEWLNIMNWEDAQDELAQVVYDFVDAMGQAAIRRVDADAIRVSFGEKLAKAVFQLVKSLQFIQTVQIQEDDMNRLFQMVASITMQPLLAEHDQLFLELRRNIYIIQNSATQQYYFNQDHINTYSTEGWNSYIRGYPKLISDLQKEADYMVYKSREALLTNFGTQATEFIENRLDIYKKLLLFSSKTDLFNGIPFNTYVARENDRERVRRQLRSVRFQVGLGPFLASNGILTGSQVPFYDMVDTLVYMNPSRLESIRVANVALIYDALYNEPIDGQEAPKELDERKHVKKQGMNVRTFFKETHERGSEISATNRREQVKVRRGLPMEEDDQPGVVPGTPLSQEEEEKKDGDGGNGSGSWWPWWRGGSHGGYLLSGQLNPWGPGQPIRTLLRKGLDNVHDFCPHKEGARGSSKDHHTCTEELKKELAFENGVGSPADAVLSWILPQLKQGKRPAGFKNDWEGTVLTRSLDILYKTYDNNIPLETQPNNNNYPTSYEMMAYELGDAGEKEDNGQRKRNKCEKKTPEQLAAARNVLSVLFNINNQQRLPYYIWDSGGQFSTLKNCIELNTLPGGARFAPQKYIDNHQLYTLSKVWDPSSGESYEPATNVMRSDVENRLMPPPAQHMYGDGQTEFKEINFAAVYRGLFHNDQELADVDVNIQPTPIEIRNRQGVVTSLQGVTIILTLRNGQQVQYGIPSGGYSVTNLNMGLAYIEVREGSSKKSGNKQKQVNAQAARNAVMNPASPEFINIAGLIDELHLKGWTWRKIRHLLYMFKSSGDHGMVETIAQYYRLREAEQKPDMLYALFMTFDRLAAVYANMNMVPALFMRGRNMMLSMGRAFSLAGYLCQWLTANPEWQYIVVPAGTPITISVAKQILHLISHKASSPGVINQDLFNAHVPLNGTLQYAQNTLTNILSLPQGWDYTQGNVQYDAESLHVQGNPHSGLPSMFKRNMLVLMNIYSKEKLEQNPRVIEIVRTEIPALRMQLPEERAAPEGAAPVPWWRRVVTALLNYEFPTLNPVVSRILNPFIGPLRQIPRLGGKKKKAVTYEEDDAEFIERFARTLMSL